MTHWFALSRIRVAARADCCGAAEESDAARRRGLALSDRRVAFSRHLNGNEVVMAATRRFRPFALVGALAIGIPNARPPPSEHVAQPVDRTLVPPRTVVGWVARTVVQLAAAQRRAPVNTYLIPPSRAPDGGSTPWLPNQRVGLPPRDTVVMPPPATVISITPMAIETRSRHVASANARGDDGMLMGLRLTFPWMIP
jgi:hypothetical protein